MHDVSHVPDNINVLRDDMLTDWIRYVGKPHDEYVISRALLKMALGVMFILYEEQVVGRCHFDVLRSVINGDIPDKMQEWPMETACGRTGIMKGSEDHLFCFECGLDRILYIGIELHGRISRGFSLEDFGTQLAPRGMYLPRTGIQ